MSDHDPGEDQVPERTAAINAATEELRGLRSDLQGWTEELASKTDLKDDAKRRRRWMIGFSVALVLLLAFTGALGVLAFKALDQAEFNGVQAELSEQRDKKLKRVAHAIKATNEILIECTTPSTRNDVHECNEQQIAGSRATVGELTALFMVAVACGDQIGVQSSAEVRACVEPELDDIFSG